MYRDWIRISPMENITAQTLRSISHGFREK